MFQFLSGEDKARTVHFQAPNSWVRLSQTSSEDELLVKEGWVFVGNSSLVNSGPCGGLRMKALQWLLPLDFMVVRREKQNKALPGKKEGAEGCHYLQVVPQDTSLGGPQVLHQLGIRLFITHHGGAHLLQGKPRRLLSWVSGRCAQFHFSSPPHCPRRSYR